jgi:hypothetical protein
MEAHFWGEEFACYLVSYDGRFFAWTVRPDDESDDVYQMPSAENARAFLASERARLLLTTSWGDRVAAVDVGDDASGRVLYSAGVFDGAEDGIWLAVLEAEGPEDVYTLTGFGALGEAVGAFADRTDQMADKIEATDIGWPKIAGGRLRYLASFARAGAARAVLGDLVRASRGRIRAERAVSRVASTAGVSREFLYHVLAGDDWTWKGLMPPRKDVLPARPRAARLKPEDRTTGWTVQVRLAIEAASESEARAIGQAALAEIGATVKDEPIAIPSSTGLWSVTALMDLSGLGTIEPDNAQTRLSFVSGRMPDKVTWVSHVKDEHQGTYEWPPRIWDRRPGADDQLLHPAIRAALIHVTDRS